MNVANNTIILTQAGDSHACAVDYCLKRLGRNSHIVDMSNILFDKDFHFRFEVQNDPYIEVSSFSGNLSTIASSWNRRFPKSYQVPSEIDKNDVEYIKCNIEAYMKGFVSTLDGIFPVNSARSIAFTSNKVNQLSIAKSLGLRIPTTIISNKVDEITSFIDAHSDVCVKPYVSHSWETPDANFMSATTRISHDLIDNRCSLRMLPHIYQSYVKKRAEYRLTIFGSYSVCTKLPQKHLSEQASYDWRSSFEYLKYLEPYQMDSKIVELCKKLMLGLDIRFGTFDLVEDDQGEIVFLEVNQAGQWLWQEYHCPDCILLEPFASFLMASDDKFNFDPQKHSTEFKAFDVMNYVYNLSDYDSILKSEVDNDPSLITVET